MIQFYLPDISTMPVLPESESGHCVRVLRMREGDELICVDGKGNRYTCSILEAHPKHVQLQVISKEEVPQCWKANIHLAFAPTKHMDRVEWMLEKCTEMGINSFVPVRCDRSERKDVKSERLEKILVSAMKQSLKATLPELDAMTPLRQLLTADIPGSKFIGYCSDEVTRREFSKEYIPGTDVTILIGPEGDFSPEEVKIAVDNGWIPVTFGDSRLRAETAGIFSVAAVHAINQKEL
ncbi:MAG: 16S rRNA (uracil(1498)-N(3))-methyltransferase [Bacteroidales bacterium]|nr:16S rRNA (uracil(1498)-N(3))-methyltransferase [Bacteroidales bacterium]